MGGGVPSALVVAAHAHGSRVSRAAVLDVDVTDPAAVQHWVRVSRPACCKQHLNACMYVRKYTYQVLGLILTLLQCSDGYEDDLYTFHDCNDRQIRVTVWRDARLCMSLCTRTSFFHRETHTRLHDGRCMCIHAGTNGGRICCTG